MFALARVGPFFEPFIQKLIIEVVVARRFVRYPLSPWGKFPLVIRSHVGREARSPAAK